jgi:hypothetical protein
VIERLFGGKFVATPNPEQAALAGGSQRTLASRGNARSRASGGAIGAGTVTMRFADLALRFRSACPRKAREVSLVGTPSNAKAAL